MSENSYLDSRLRESRAPLLEILEVIKHGDLEAMKLEPELEEVVGRLTFWINLKREEF